MLTDPSTIALAGVAAAMAGITAVLIRWASEARTRTAAAVVLFLLGMMISMLGGALLYFLRPGTTSLVEGLWFASAAMSVTVFPVVTLFLREAVARHEQGAAFSPAPLGRRGAFALSVLALVLVNEFLMGWTFQLASGSVSAGAATSALQVLVVGVDTPWFLFPMALEMALSAYFLRRALPRAVLGLLLAQSALMALSPTAFSGAGAIDLAVGLGSAVMIGIIVFLMEHLYRRRALPRVVAGYVLGLLTAYAVMMAGLYEFVVDGSGLLFAVSVLLEMALFFDVIVLAERFEAPATFRWLDEPHWAFGLLATIFVAELFMGAVLDLAIQPAVYDGALIAPALTGSPGAQLGEALQNGFWWVAAVTGSTWFLGMMGFEMGALVAWKYRETRSTETRVRLALMMACYGAFVVFFPSTYYSALFPNAPSGTAVPVLGWSMGIGSAPLAPAVFTVLLVTYGVTGVLCALFGRRVVCSTFCSAALMYQGTTLDAMKSFNRSSPIAHKYLGSRFSTAYSVTTGLVMGSLALASVASYMDSIGRWSVSIAGADPTVFLFALYFGILWYVLFVTIPYTGNYNCVTMGWCYTGTFAQAFQRLGPFSLRVRDKEVCKRCTTLDCAKSCPVGLVDMPGHFRQRGVFRSTKCCGVGNCAGACPYGNLYLYDIRHWLRDRFSRSREMGTPLPMVRSSAARAPTPSSLAPGAGEASSAR